MEKITFPRFMLAAPSSGSGKTLITCAILAILKSEGLKCVSFKCGPDYIDPMFHREISGIPSWNLDLYLSGEDGIKRTLAAGAKGRDIGIIEGVMGFFDGMGADDITGSSFDLCRRTNTPAILIVNAKGMSGSILPLVKGFCEYNDNACIKGIILNNISKSISGVISQRILNETGIPVIGTLPAIKNVRLMQRHLGLVLPGEVPELLSFIEETAGVLKENLELKMLLEIAEGAGEAEDVLPQQSNPSSGIKIAIARDEAFCFYYEDNLSLLREMGAEPVFFSPVHDKHIPEASGVILGGGYPELFAGELSANISMRNSIKEAADNNLPILAECGGFLYLLESLKDPDGNIHEMAGVLSGSSYMTDKSRRFGYTRITSRIDNPFLLEGETIRGHEFHYYDTTDNGELCLIQKPSGTKSWYGYRTINRVFAGFSHLYYPSCPEFIRRFLGC